MAPQSPTEPEGTKPPAGSDGSGAASPTPIGPEPFRSRLERYRPYLTVLARVQVGQRLRGMVDPEDLVQDTCLAAVAGAGRFRGAGDGELTAWLRAILASRVFRLVERHCGTDARDVRRETAPPVAAGSSPSGFDVLPADQSTPSRAALRRERAVAVATALNTLPAEHRDVLVYRNMENLTFPQVAERMGRSVGAVTMLWTRAVRQFRIACPSAA